LEEIVEKIQIQTNKDWAPIVTFFRSSSSLQQQQQQSLTNLTHLGLIICHEVFSSARFVTSAGYRNFLV
jgi:hypothetical protein